MEDCIFCQIAEGRIPSVRVYEDKDFIVFMDITPLTKGHCLLVTREHYASTDQMPEKLLAKALPLAKKIALATKIAVGAEGYNFLQNNGSMAGQVVNHWHLHIIPRNNAEEMPLKAGSPANVTQLPFTASDIRANLDI